MLREQQGTSSFIMDTEVVAVDPNDGTLKSFQELSNRARKSVRLEDVKVTVCVFAFDLMYVSGQVSSSLIFFSSKSNYRSDFVTRVSLKNLFASAETDYVRSFQLFLTKVSDTQRGLPTSRAVRVMKEEKL